MDKDVVSDYKYIMMNLENGDPFEREQMDWLRKNLRIYENIWGNFIGNDGNNQMLQMNDLPPDMQKKRIVLAEAHYTFARTMYRIDQTVTKIQKLQIDVKSFSDCDKASELLTTFYMHIGRAYDMIDRVTGALGDSDIKGRLSHFHEQRNAVLHSTIVPFDITPEGFIKIPEIEGTEVNNQAWNGKQNWKDVPCRDYLVDKIPKEKVAFFKAVQGVHSNILEKFKIYFDGYNLSPPSTTFQVTPNNGSNAFESNSRNVTQSFQSPSGVSHS